MAPKRRRRDDKVVDAVDAPKGMSRRKNACQSCRLRKVKCDARRPQSATELLNSKLSRLQDGVDKLQELAQLQHVKCRAATEQPYEAYVDSASATSQVDAEHITESSSEFLQIPAQRTTADAVLRWEIFEDRYPPSALVGMQCSGGGAQDQDSSNDGETFTVRSGVLAPNEEQIPNLIESFLRNVHTKNPGP
ncbi:hypothetical protein LTR94_004904 [Friedmanniomyces endolithicus]|nr:hypothetical protein LTR94_004904 [Friedmanniomyces endolithicus]